MKKDITIDVCDYPKCPQDRQLATCYHCGKVVCEQHRFEGVVDGQQMWICWMDLPGQIKV